MDDDLLYVEEEVPAEFLYDDTHPANDQYLKTLRQLQRQTVAHCASMRDTHIQICKLAHTGHKTAEIADRVGVTRTTVRKTLNSDAGKRLNGLLAYITLTNDGATEAQRRGMLWRMAVRNEEIDPRVSISAVAELNRMNNTQKDRESGGAGGIQIVINNEQMPRTVLDQ